MTKNDKYFIGIYKYMRDTKLKLKYQKMTKNDKYFTNIY